MIILNKIYQDNSLSTLIKDMEFQSFANGEILQGFEYNPPGIEDFIESILRFKPLIANSVFFKPNSGMIVNEHFSLYVCLSDTTMTTYIGTEQYNRVEIKNGQALILEPMIYHSFESDLLQFIEFKPQEIEDGE
jgi:hypothetical protein